MITVKHLKKEDYSISNWSGGKTIQLAIAPEGAVYADRDFLWRLSSATVELEESDFTALPDYNRWITPLKGEMVLSHNGGPEIDLQPYQVHAFDGADHTHSKGCCTDFNLMLRKGQCGGSIEMLNPAAAEDLRGKQGYIGGVQKSRFVPDSKAETVLLFCQQGSVNASVAGQSYLIREGETLLVAWESQTAECEMTASPGMSPIPAVSKKKEAGEMLPEIEIDFHPGGCVMAAQMWHIL